MKHEVITGGMRGTGFGMARGFLRRGHQVTVCGRSADGAVRASALLAAEHGGERLAASCDVGDYDQVRNPWEEAVGRFGAVDVRINNAGLPNPSHDFWELEAGLVEEVVRADVLAMRGILEQGHGQIYDPEGLGSDGMIRPGAVVNGATRSAVTYLTRGLVKEAKGTS